MEKIRIKSLLEIEIEKAIRDRIERNIDVQMAVDTKHGREVRKSVLSGIIESINWENGDMEVRKTTNGISELVKISLYEVKNIS
jgi:hypothetical protein